MIFALIAACGFGLFDADPSQGAVSPDNAAGAVATAEPPKASFDPLPADVELILEPAGFQALVAPYDLGPSLAGHAQRVSYNTAVAVPQMAAVRTGAELGALMVEASHQSPAVVTARLARIHDGLVAIKGDGPVLDPVTKLSAAVDAGLHGEAWVQVLQAHHALIQDSLVGHVGSDTVPLLLAGAWMQGALLSIQAIRERGEYGAAPVLLRRPEIGRYFEAWVDHVGNDLFPEAALTGVKGSMADLRRLTDQDHISPQDAAAIQETLEGLLGMI